MLLVGIVIVSTLFGYFLCVARYSLKIQEINAKEATIREMFARTQELRRKIIIDMHNSIRADNDEKEKS